MDGRIRFVCATRGRRYFCIRMKKFADTKISGYVWTGPKLLFRYYCYYYYLLTTHLSQVSSSEFAMPRNFTVLTKLKKTLDEINSIGAFPLLVHAKGLRD